MKYLKLLFTLCMAATVLLAVPSCSTSKNAAAGKESRQQTQVKKKKISLWHWWGKKQKAYLFSCRQGESLRYCYSYDGLVWKMLLDAEGRPVTSIPKEAIAGTRQPKLKSMPQQVTGTMAEDTQPQVIRIGKYNCIFWNKAIARRPGCLRSSGSLNDPKRAEDVSEYLSFPKGVRLEAVFEIQPKALKTLLGI